MQAQFEVQSVLSLTNKFLLSASDVKLLSQVLYNILIIGIVLPCHGKERD